MHIIYSLLLYHWYTSMQKCSSVNISENNIIEKNYNVDYNVLYVTSSLVGI